MGLAVLALPCLLYSMDLTVLHLAVPKLTADLRPSSVELLWIIDIYGFLVAGSLITMGTLGDRIGRRRLLLIGAAAFGVASIAAAFSTSARMLIATRALLGVAGATIAPSTLSLIRNMFLDPRQRTTAIGVWITSFSVGGAIGPLVGGIAAGDVLVGLGLPARRPGDGAAADHRTAAAAGVPGSRRPRRLDLLSALLSLLAVLAVIYGLKRIAQDGLAVGPVLFIVAGLAVGAVFVRRQLRLPDPLIDLRLFRMPGFSASLATYGLSILFSFGGFLFLPQYLQLVLGLSPFRAALWTVPWDARLRGRFDAGTGARAADPPCVRDGGRPHAGGDRFRDVHAHRFVDRVRDVRHRLDDVRAWPRAGLHADHRPGRRVRAARARRRGVGDLGDQRRIRRRARHRDLRQHRRGDLPNDAGRRAADGCSGPGGGRGRARRWAVRSWRPASSRRHWARS